MPWLSNPRAEAAGKEGVRERGREVEKDKRKRIEFTRGWSFEGAWGSGPGLEGEVAPEVRKRKFGGSVDADGGYRLLENIAKRVKRM